VTSLLAITSVLRHTCNGRNDVRLASPQHFVEEPLLFLQTLAVTHSDGNNMDPRFRIDPIRDLESLDRYEVGGFHPVHIGEELHDRRYEVLHRLGNGHFSTVWLAEDMYITDRPTDSPRIRYVAIKIFAADFHPDKYDGDRLWGLRESSLDTKDFSVKDGLRHVVTALNEFEISGPNGTHQALVMELLGPSVASVIYKQPIPVELSRRIILQLAKALASLHSFGMVHGGLRSRLPCKRIRGC
jgi:serine/threonine-protein kinase SRPK3